MHKGKAYSCSNKLNNLPYDKLKKEYLKIKSYWEKDQNEINNILLELEDVKNKNLDLNEYISSFIKKPFDEDINNIEEFNDDKWWNNLNLDKMELDAYITMNKINLNKIDNLKHKLRLTRKYSRNLRKRLIKLSKTKKEPLIKDIYTIRDEHIFRNKCLEILYGELPNYYMWKEEDLCINNINYDNTYWNNFSENESEKIIKWFIDNYYHLEDFKATLNYFNYLKYNNKIRYKEFLIYIIDWLFNPNLGNYVY